MFWSFLMICVCLNPTVIEITSKTISSKKFPHKSIWLDKLMNSTQINNSLNNFLITMQPYASYFSKNIFGFFVSIFFYFTAAPFSFQQKKKKFFNIKQKVFKFVVLPTINKIYNFYIHQTTWETKKISSYVTCTL